MEYDRMGIKAIVIERERARDLLYVSGRYD